MSFFDGQDFTSDLNPQKTADELVEEHGAEKALAIVNGILSKPGLVQGWKRFWTKVYTFVHPRLPKRGV